MANFKPFFFIFALIFLQSCGATYTASDGSSVEVGPQAASTTQDTSDSPSEEAEDSSEVDDDSEVSEVDEEEVENDSSDTVAEESPDSDSVHEESQNEEEPYTTEDSTALTDLAFEDWPEPRFSSIRKAKGGRSAREYWDYTIEYDQAECARNNYNEEKNYMDPLLHDQLKRWAYYFCVCYYEVLATIAPVEEADSGQLEWAEYMAEEGFTYTCQYLAEKSYPLYRGDL